MRFILIISLLLPVLIFAQSPSWKSVSIEPSIQIKEMVSDSLGFLWLYEKSTLYRFDGLEARAKLELGEGKISSLDYSQTGQISIGTHQGKVLLYNPYTREQKILLNFQNEHSVSGTYIKDSLNFIVLYYGHGIGVMNKGSFKKLTVENGLLSNEVYEVAWFNDRYYIATDQGIQIIVPEETPMHVESLTMVDGLSDVVITNLSVYREELWYTDYNQHLGKITKQGTITNYLLPEPLKINGIETHASGVYLGTDQGLYEFNDGVFQNKFLTELKTKINVFKIDNEGNIWIITGAGNLFRGNLYFQKTDMDITAMRTIEKYKGEIIIGNEDGLFRPINDSYRKISEENVTHLCRVEDYLLVGTFSQGLKVYDQHFNLVQEVDSWTNIANESVLSIYNQDQEVFVSSLSGVMIFEFRNGRLSPKNSLNKVIGQAYIYTMLLDGDKMYLGTDRNGLYIWNRLNDSIVLSDKFISEEKIGSVYALTKDKEGKIWFSSTEHGLGYLENNKPKKLVHSLRSKDEYTSLKLINDGSLLAIGGSSIDIIDSKNNRLRQYGKELDINSENTFLNNIVLDGQKTFFAHDQSLFTYTPDKAVTIHPKVIIDQVRVNLSPAKGRQLFEENENNIAFDFQGSWLTGPLKLTYQYKLEGFDEEWRNTKDNSVSYPKLRAGQYSFKLKVSENGMFSDEIQTEYVFHIKKHFYNKRWVRFIALSLIALMIIVLLLQRETRKQEKIALEKLNIENQIINLKNQLNPHFLFNAFNTLIGLIEEDSEKSIDFVEKMTDFYRNILESGKSNMIPLSEEKEILSQYIDILETRFAGQLRIKMKFEKNLSRYEIPPMTLQLLIENAVKHNVVSTKKPLSIFIHQNGNEISIKNKKAPLLSANTGTKTGLNNIIRRFELVNLDTPTILETFEDFEVILKIKKS